MTFYKYASPVTWIQTGSAPTISFFGSTDTAVPIIEQQARLENKLTQFNVPHESYVWAGDHVAFAVEPNLSFILAKSKAFLALYNP